MMVKTIRWENERRWYEASIVIDLIEDITIVRRWGAKDSERGSQKIEIIASLEAAHRRLKELGKQRAQRPEPYRQVMERP